MIYILYHKNCYDGFGSAFAAWKKFGNTATYIACDHGKPIPELPKAKEIYILDFSFELNKLYEWAKTAKVIVLDHHKTAFEKLAQFKSEQIKEDSKYTLNDENLLIHLDNSQSGAYMSRYYFNDYKKVPELMFHYLMDRDLWKFELGHGTKEFHAAISSYPMDFKLWDTFLNNEIKLLDEGKVLLRKEEIQVENICKNAYWINLDNYKVICVNTSVCWSEIGNKLLDLYPESPFAVSYTEMSDNVTMYSLRSRENFDVSQVAKKFGGGGHKQAAGFKLVRH